MKKSVWLVLCIALIAVVLIAVFASQRNSAQLAEKELKTQLEELNAQLEASRMATETATQLRITDLQQSEEKVKQAEEAKEQAENELNAASERTQELETQVAAQQASIDSAVEQLRLVAQQAQSTISALTGEDEESLQKTLADTQQELETVKADYAQATSDLLAAQEQLTEMRSVLTAAEAAKFSKTAVRIYKGDRLVVEFEDLSLLNEKKLAEGLYRLEVSFLNPAGEEIVKYELPYVVTSETEEAAENGQEEAPAEGEETVSPAEEALGAEEQASDGADAEGSAEAPETEESTETEPAADGDAA